MAKANWFKAPYSTNARNVAAANCNHREVAPSKVEKAVEPSKPAVSISMRCSGIEFMYRHGDISEAQKNVAARFHGLYEAATSDGLQGMDYSRVKVDGGQPGSGGMIDRRLRARDELGRIRFALGDQHFEALRLAAGEERSMSEVAAALGMKASTTGGRRVKKALEALSRHWGAEDTGYGIRAEAG